ncbi:hypothetical protein M2436_004101 [Streptomyces sp. HB372]|nr:hypothetical protein [Streptomyces sp. HB372]
MSSTRSCGSRPWKTGSRKIAVRHRVDPAHRVPVRLRVRQRAQRVEVQGEGDLGGVRQEVAQDAGARAVGQVQVVGGAQGREVAGPARGVDPVPVPEERRAPGLVERRPGRHPVAQRPGHQARVLREPVRRVPLGPAARVLQLLRQVPVVERGDRSDPGRQQLVDQTAVEVQAALHGRAPAGRLDPGPGDGEPVVGDAQFLHQAYVVRHPVQMVGGDVAGVAVAHLAGRPAEGVPDRRRTAVLGGSALDLIGGGGGPPAECGGEAESRHGLGAGTRGGRRTGIDSGHGTVTPEVREEGGKGGQREGAGQPFTAPCMMPPTICRPSRPKTSSTGSVPSSVPAMITDWSLT